jgi:hypothetical protein
MKTQIKTILLIGFILALTVIPFAGFTQNNFEFGYDNAGNRISRTIVTLKSATVQDGLTAINPIEEKIGFTTTRIYPNPTKGILHLEISTEINQSAYCTVHDINGKLILKNNSFQNQTDVNLSLHPAGIYILRVFIGTDSKEWKVIKE